MRNRGALLGLAVGDALGTTYEFARLDQVAYPALAIGPATDIVGGGPFGLAPGQVTDDTQLAVCLARSLADRQGFDPADVARRYVAWREHAFDVGNQTAAALRLLEEGESVISEVGVPAAGHAVWLASGRHAAGNGSLMRTAPLAIAYARRDADELIAAALAESAITHADPRCMLACVAFDLAIARAVTTPTRGADLVATALAGLERARPAIARALPDEPDAIAAAYQALERDLEAALADDPGVYGEELDLHRTAGFVRVALRLAFWHAVHTPSWRDAVVDVASRGGDADTNAAIVGALLGARDGAAAIPPAWIERVLGATQPGPAAWADAHHPRHLLALIA